MGGGAYQGGQGLTDDINSSCPESNGDGWTATFNTAASFTNTGVIVTMCATEPTGWAQVSSSYVVNPAGEATTTTIELTGGFLADVPPAEQGHLLRRRIPDPGPDPAPQRSRPPPHRPVPLQIRLLTTRHAPGAVRAASGASPIGSSRPGRETRAGHAVWPNGSSDARPFP